MPNDIRDLEFIYYDSKPYLNLKSTPVNTTTPPDFEIRTDEYIKIFKDGASLEVGIAPNVPKPAAYILYKQIKIKDLLNTQAHIKLSSVNVPMIKFEDNDSSKEAIIINASGIYLIGTDDLRYKTSTYPMHFLLINTAGIYLKYTGSYLRIYHDKSSSGNAASKVSTYFKSYAYATTIQS